MAELTGSNLQIYSPEKTKKWLSWIARGMIAHNQTIFMIERLQPSWLPIRFLRWIYLLVSRVTIITLAGCSVLIYIETYILTKFLVANVMIGFIISVVEIASEWLFSHIDMDKRKWLTGFLGLSSYPIVFIISAFIIYILFNQSISEDPFHGYVLLVWTIQIPVFFNGRSVLLGLNQDMKAVEGLSFSFKRMMKGAFFGLIPAFVIGLLMFEYPKLSSGWYLLGVVFFFSVVMAFFSGLIKSVQDIGDYPNQGLKLSIRNAILIFGLIAIFVSIFVAIYLSFIFSMNLSVETIRRMSGFFGGFFGPAIIGPLLGFFGILFYGGIFVIKHFTLRCLLSMCGYLPWNLARFLDYCVDLNFLQKVGGGYQFIHKYVMEHFAEIQL
jgi:eukaryotic-like serine/threonine-protein kinase